MWYMQYRDGRPLYVTLFEAFTSNHTLCYSRHNIQIGVPMTNSWNNMLECGLKLP